MISEEEQIRLLQKMLYHTENRLSDHEMDLYNQLIEYLSKRATRIHHIGRQTAKLKRLPGKPDKDIAEIDQSKKGAVRNRTPEEVVRLFIDSWSIGDFDTEYYCLSRDCQKGARDTLRYEEYIKNRRTRWGVREKRGINEKKLHEIISSELRGSRTIIQCIESHRTSMEEIMLCRNYELLYEDGGWRIVDFSTISTVKHPRTPKI